MTDIEIDFEVDKFRGDAYNVTETVCVYIRKCPTISIICPHQKSSSQSMSSKQGSKCGSRLDGN